MLFVLVLMIFLASLLFFLINRNRRSILILLSSFTLALFIIGILLYISKKGGISSQMSLILFGPRRVRVAMQYARFTLNQLGYFLALGRYCFPFFLLITCMDMSYADFAIKAEKKFYLFLILPVVSLILYYPSIFKFFAEKSDALIRFMLIFSRSWIFLYVVFSMVILVWEFFSITMGFFRKRFLFKSLLMISLAMIYCFYAPQDPAQVYLFYRNNYMWMLGLWYLSSAFNSPLYIIVMAGSILFAFIGFVSLLRYVSLKFDESRQDVVLRQKAQDASIGISTFNHSTKNELLASSILLSRLEKKFPGDEDVLKLKGINSNLMQKMESLYKASKNEQYRLVPENLEKIIQESVKQVFVHHPDSDYSIEMDVKPIFVLADFHPLSEALSNLMENAWEAQKANGVSDSVVVSIRRERLWISISITDKGCGISEKDAKRIWEPFYSTKNSSKNWGMGMYYSRKVIKSHLGSVRFESPKQGGTRFVVLLPKTGAKEVVDD